MSDPDFEPEGAAHRVLHVLDRSVWALGGVFMLLCNVCMMVMLTLTAATIVLRPFDISAYWVWPWTMVFFVWLSFFGFFAIYARLKDVRVDFLAVRLGDVGMAATRVVSDLAAIAICGVLVYLAPRVLATSTGWVDGAILPGGEELPRQALSVPLVISSVLVVLAALLDLAKFAAGIPERVSHFHPEV